MRTALILFLLLVASRSSSQILFAPNQNTTWNDRPYGLIEIPGSRYVFTISQEEILSYNTTRMDGLVFITDVNGNVLHKRSFPSDTFHICKVSNIHFLNNSIYLNVTLGKDSLGLNVPVWGGLIKMDTTLSVIDKWLYPIGNSTQYISTNLSTTINNTVYCLYGKVVAFASTLVVHPVIRAYDVNGSFLRERELDTTFFSPEPGGFDYTLLPYQLDKNGSSLVISAGCGKVDALGFVSTHSYIISVDTMFNLVHAASVGCLSAACTSVVKPGSLRVFGVSNSTYLGGIVYDQGSVSGNALVKYNLAGPLPPPHIDYSPDAFSIVSDSNGYKYPTVSNISIFDHAAYYVGHTSFFAPSIFSPYQNRLIVSKCDTNTAVSWVKYIGGDAHYFPSNILATSDHGCIVTAYRYDHNVPSNQFDNYIFKLDSAGNLLSVKSLNTNQVQTAQIYPNPASNSLTVDFGINDYRSLEVFDMEGRLSIVTKCARASISVDVSNLVPGLYSCHIKDIHGAVVLVKLFVKK